MTLDAVDLCEELVRVPSVNGDLDPTCDEGQIAQLVADVLRDLGAEPHLHEVLPGRPNVTAVFDGYEDSPTLLFESHLDTVPLADPPQRVERSDGRIWGRGSCDTKSSAAAMLAAIEQVVSSGRQHGRIIFAGVVDEEYVMRGAGALLASIPAVDGIVIGEPTELESIRAHNGCVRFDIEARGRTAHSSRAELGINAVLALGEAIRALEAEVGQQRRSIQHELTGRGLLTPTVIQGGVAPNVVPDRAVVRYDRRLLPGEESADVLADVDAVVARLNELGHDITRGETWLELAPMETASDHPLVAVTEAASTRATGEHKRSIGVPYCTDACVLTGRDGVPSVVVGPGSIDQAHTPIEWVEIDQIERAVDLYAAIMTEAVSSTGW